MKIKTFKKENNEVVKLSASEIIVNLGGGRDFR